MKVFQEKTKKTQNAFIAKAEEGHGNNGTATIQDNRSKSVLIQL